MPRIESCDLLYQKGASDKVYEIELFENDGVYGVLARYGRRGCNLKIVHKSKGRGTFGEAMATYIKIVNQKLQKGYCITRQCKAGDAPHDESRKPQAPSVDPATAVASVLDRLACSAPPSLGF
jgi:hypothetical protein